MKKTKVVNIYPTMPITRINPPIRSCVKNVTKSIEEIRTCLMSRAIVEEVTPNGVIRLDNTNYDKDNTPCSHGCACGLCAGTNVESKPAVNENTEASIWDKAYNDAIAGVDLASMTRKQRRAAEAAARDAANKAVAAIKNVENTKTDVMEEATTEDTTAEDIENTITETVSTEEATTENAVDKAEVVEEAAVETIDIEQIKTDSVE